MKIAINADNIETIHLTKTLLESVEEIGTLVPSKETETRNFIDSGIIEFFEPMATEILTGTTVALLVERIVSIFRSKGSSPKAINNSTEEVEEIIIIDPETNARIEIRRKRKQS